MSNGLVTIVLPIYNVEKYLNRCINSIVNQTYKNLEIILVDDGSPDKCPEMCDEWEKKDTRIKVIHKQNEGLGMARNTGIENATGDYICFFDSDDYLELTAIEKLYKLAEKTDPDIVTYGYSKVNDSGNIYEKSIPNVKKITYEKKEIMEEFLPDMIFEVETSDNHNLHMSAWASMYSLEVILNSGWRFVSEREVIAEDVYSLMVLYQNIRRVSVLEEALYYYCDNGASLTHVFRKDRYKKIKYFHQACIKKANELKYSSKIKLRLAGPYYNFTLAAMKMIVMSKNKKQEKIEALNEIILDQYLRNVLETLDVGKKDKKKRIINYFIKKKLVNICYIILFIKEKTR